MRRATLLAAAFFMLSAHALGQGTTSYPATLDSSSTLPQAVDNKVTFLTAAATSGAAAISVNSTAGLPSTVVAQLDAELLSCSVTNATTLTCSRGFSGTAAAAHAVRATVRFPLAAAHVNGPRGAALALEAKVGVGSETAAAAATGEVLTKKSDGTTGWETAAGATLSGADNFLMLPMQYFGGTIAATGVGSANEVRVLRFRLAESRTFSSLRFELATASAGAFCSVAVYSSDGNTKLMDSGAMSTTAAGVKSGGSSTTLPAGFYWLAWTASNTTAQFRTLAQNSNWAAVLNDGATHLGAAANPSSSGAMPATLGTVTAGAYSAPVVKLQG